MDQSAEIRACITAQPSGAEIARRQRAIDAIRKLQVSIVPMSVVELRRLARQDEDGPVDAARLDP